MATMGGMATTAPDLKHLLEAVAGVATERKQRLLVCALAPYTPQWQGKAALRDAIVLAEWAADGAPVERSHDGPPGFGLWHFLCLVPEVADIKRAVDIAEAASIHHSAACRRCVSCIFGHLFHQVAIERHWLAAYGGAVAKLAEAIYVERAFDRMPILADALEEAGCHHAEILAHCRGGGEHVRGCWGVDLLTGRE